ncbi:hypothetical protein Syun_012472 [Stephania yunnanensis]|uniref:Uncharacterized protein n=1 Tax=Stephania yunnanensis TaxID=152371 RepID=A0AAP0K1V8_9MAGN
MGGARGGGRGERDGAQAELLARVDGERDRRDPDDAGRRVLGDAGGGSGHARVEGGRSGWQVEPESRGCGRRELDGSRGCCRPDLERHGAQVELLARVAGSIGVARVGTRAADARGSRKRRKGGEENLLL